MDRFANYLAERPVAIVGVLVVAMLSLYLCGYSRGRLDSYLAAYASKARSEAMKG